MPDGGHRRLITDVYPRITAKDNCYELRTVHEGLRRVCTGGAQNAHPTNGALNRPRPRPRQINLAQPPRNRPRFAVPQHRPVDLDYRADEG